VTDLVVSKNPYAPLEYRPGTRRIKVLLISHTCQSRTEGQPKAHALASLPDIDLHLLTPKRWLHYGSWREAQPPIDPQFQITMAPVRFPWVGPAQYFLHYYPSLPKLLTTFKPDVIDLWEEPWGYVSAHTCKLRNRLLPSAKIVSETEQNINKHLPFPFEKFRTFTLRQANFAVGRNVESIDVIRSKGYTGPAQVVPNAVDTRLFRPLDRAGCKHKLLAEISALNSQAQIENQKSKFESPSDIFLAGYAGRLVPEKGLMDLLDALPQAPANVHVVLVGSGPQEAELRARAGALNLAHRLHILPARPLEQLPEVFNALDVFVLPSRTTARWKEQFGRVIIEAHACGTPVIGSNSGGIPDVIADGGLIVPELDPPAIAAALTRFATDPSFAAACGRAGLETARSHYTWQTVARTMAAIYQRVVA